MKLCKKTALWLCVTVLSLLLMSFNCAASENFGTPIDLYINSNPVEGARLADGTAYIPYRAGILAADPEATFAWDDARGVSVATSLGMTIEAKADEHYIEANARILYTELAKNRNIDGTLYVPIRWIARGTPPKRRSISRVRRPRLSTAIPSMTATLCTGCPASSRRRAAASPSAGRLPSAMS